MSRTNVRWVAAGLAIILGIGSYQATGQAPTGPAVPKPKNAAGHDFKMVSVDLLLIDVSSKKGEDDKPGAAQTELDARALTGPMGKVMAKVEALKKAGRIAYLRRIQLSAAEGYPASVTIGETKPSVAGTNVTATGHVTKNFSYRNTGTSAKLTARTASDERVTMDLNIEDSRLRVPEDGVSVGTDEKGHPIPAAEFANAKLDTALSVRSGQAVAVQAVQTDTQLGQEQTFVIVGARILGPND